MPATMTDNERIAAAAVIAVFRAMPEAIRFTVLALVCKVWCERPEMFRP